jgi:putative membrane protein
MSFWVGITFVLLGAYSAIAATVQYRKVLRAMKPVEIPDDYSVNRGIIVNLLVAFLGLALVVYIFVAQ